MKPKILSLLIFFLILFLSFSLQAGKQQSLTVQIINSETNVGVSGLEVYLMFAKAPDIKLISDENGMCHFWWSKKDPYQVNVLDPKGLYSGFIENVEGEDFETLSELIYYVPRKLLFDKKYYLERDAYYDSLNASGEIYGSFGNESCEALDTISLASTMQVIYGQVSYPQEAIELEIQGKVYVEFIIEKDGTVTHANIIKGVHELLDKEALRVVYTLPKIKFGTCEGEPVRTKARLPIIFTLH